MHKATLIGIPAVVPPAGFEIRRQGDVAAEASAPDAAPAPSEPPAEAPPPPAAEADSGGISLQQKLSSVPPPPAGDAPASQPPSSQVTSVSVESDLDDLPTGRSRSPLLPLLLVAAAAALLVGYFVTRPSGEVAQAPQATATPTTNAPVQTAEPAAAATAPAEPSQAGSDEATDSEPSAGPAGSAVAEAPSAEQPAAAGATVVVVTAEPDQATFYYKGKKVGGSPMRVELQPGEKRAYEVGLRGYGTRKVVVDGTQSEITVGLRKTQPPPRPSSPTKALPKATDSGR
jgi:hypothetical protein